MNKLLTADEVADRLGVTKGWVWAQARAGRIPHVQLGRYRRFREETLLTWIEDLEQGPTDGVVRYTSPNAPASSERDEQFDIA